jgi:hypothetical protein
MAPREGNSIVKFGVLDERLNVHGVKGLKVADLSICPDNVGCNTYSTALLIGEKCAVLTAEDLGYSGHALDMRVPEYHAPRYVHLCRKLIAVVANMHQGSYRSRALVVRTMEGVGECRMVSAISIDRLAYVGSFNEMYTTRG